MIAKFSASIVWLLSSLVQATAALLNSIFRSVQSYFIYLNLMSFDDGFRSTSNVAIVFSCVIVCNPNSLDLSGISCSNLKSFVTHFHKFNPNTFGKSVIASYFSSAPEIVDGKILFVFFSAIENLFPSFILIERIVPGAYFLLVYTSSFWRSLWHGCMPIMLDIW